MCYTINVVKHAGVVNIILLIYWFKLLVTLFLLLTTYEICVRDNKLFDLIVGWAIVKILEIVLFLFCTTSTYFEIDYAFGKIKIEIKIHFRHVLKKKHLININNHGVVWFNGLVFATLRLGA